MLFDRPNSGFYSDVYIEIDLKFTFPHNTDFRADLEVSVDIYANCEH